MFTKKEKAILFIFIPLCIALFMIYSIVVRYEQKLNNVLTYPEGTLSDSLFVSQNNTYTESASLPNKTALTTVPYDVDLPNGTIASVGNGKIVQVNEVSYIYISEFDSNQNAESIMLDEFPGALLIDYDPLYTYAQTLKSQEGYINGFAAQYTFNMLSVSNGAVVKTAYIASYDLRSVDDEEANHILLSVITTNCDTQSFNSIKKFLDTVTMTIRYDSAVEKAIANAKQKAEKEAAAAGKDKPQESKPEETKPTEQPENDNFSVDNGKVNYDSIITDDDEDVRVIPLDIDKNYKNLVIAIKTDIAVEGSEISLYDKELNQFERKIIEDEGTTTKFEIGEITSDMQGKYVLKITHYTAFGKVSAQVGEGE